MHDVQSEIVSCLHNRFPKLEAVWLFGSRAKKVAKPDSDYDIIFLANKTQTKRFCFELSQELGNVLGADVDLIDLGLASAVYRSQIVTNSDTLYSDKSLEVDYFEAFVYSDFARLNGERIGILKGIKKSGMCMTDDVLLNKATSIECCVQRVMEEYRGHESELKTNFTRQDAILLNVLRACEAAIDLAMHIVRKKRLGVPQSSHDSFDLLATNS